MSKFEIITFHTANNLLWKIRRVFLLILSSHFSSGESCLIDSPGNKHWAHKQSGQRDVTCIATGWVFRNCCYISKWASNICLHGTQPHCPDRCWLFKPEENGALQANPILEGFSEKSHENTAEKFVLPGIREEKEEKPILKNFSQALQIPVIQTSDNFQLCPPTSISCLAEEWREGEDRQSSFPICITSE